MKKLLFSLIIFCSVSCVKVKIYNIDTELKVVHIDHTVDTIKWNFTVQDRLEDTIPSDHFHIRLEGHDWGATGIPCLDYNCCTVISTNVQDYKLIKYNCTYIKTITQF